MYRNEREKEERKECKRKNAKTVWLLLFLLSLYDRMYRHLVDIKGKRRSKDKIPAAVIYIERDKDFPSSFFFFSLCLRSQQVFSLPLLRGASCIAILFVSFDLLFIHIFTPDRLHIWWVCRCLYIWMLLSSDCLYIYVCIEFTMRRDGVRNSFLSFFLSLSICFALGSSSLERRLFFFDRVCKKMKKVLLTFLLRRTR